MGLENKIKKIEIKVDSGKCKGCYLCIEFCPKQVLEISKTSNEKGYFPVQVKNKENCIGCGNCYIICPEGICIEIYRK